MQFRKLPKNGDYLSVLGFGCMRLPTLKNGNIDEERATRQVRFAIDHGVNYIDTAWYYHMQQSEPFLGRALSGGYREKVKIATKLPSWDIEKRKEMDTFLNSQLNKLNSEFIDYYLIHGIDGEMWQKLKKLNVIDFIEKAKSSGLIKNVGFSFHGAGKDFPLIVDDYDWDFCLIQYNFLDEKNQAGTAGLKYAAEKGLGVFVMEPLRGGKLVSPVPSSVKQIWDEAEIKRTPAEWALRWVWNHPEVVVVLSGMNNEKQIEENLTIAETAYPNSLTDAELQLIKKAARRYRKQLKVDCTGCRYCMPCPSGVNIPFCFEEYDNLYMTDNKKEQKFLYASRLGGIFTASDPEFASLCTECGVCIDKCPQHIDIPTVLKSVVAELEDSDLEKRVAKARQIFSRQK
ncbi:MAG TPA: aldo/keto reductase [Dehalococcoidales bacterium]|nr:aldo/keto reductase [Dehalococcoidales bacterium]